MSANLNLDHIHATVALSGGVDVGLDDVNAALTLAGGADFGLDDVKVQAAATLAGNVGVDLGLDDVRINQIAPINTNSKVDLGLDDIRIRELPPIKLELSPIKLELSIKPVRVHLPLSYSFCVELFGIKLFKFSICGEGMVVSEDYQPHATEQCR